jgi:hypothetical protein
MSVDWNHTDGIDNSIKFNPKFNPAKNKKNQFGSNRSSSFRPSVGGKSLSSADLFRSTMSQSNLLEQESSARPSLGLTAPDSIDFLARKPLVENVTLKLFPMYYDEMTVQPKVRMISMLSLSLYLCLSLCLSVSLSLSWSLSVCLALSLSRFNSIYCDCLSQLLKLCNVK